MLCCIGKRRAHVKAARGRGASKWNCNSPQNGRLYGPHRRHDGHSGLFYGQRAIIGQCRFETYVSVSSRCFRRIPAAHCAVGGSRNPRTGRRVGLSFLRRFFSNETRISGQASWSLSMRGVDLSPLLVVPERGARREEGLCERA